MESTPDRDRPGDPRRPRGDAGVRVVHRRGHQQRRRLRRWSCRPRTTTGDRRLRRRRTGRRGPGRVAARAAPADRPDPLDRHAARGSRRRRSSEDAEPAEGRPDVTAPHGQPAGLPRRRSSPSSSPSPAGIAAAVGYWHGQHRRPARPRARRRARRHRVRPGVLGQVPRPRRARRPAPRAAADLAGRRGRSCTEEITTAGEIFGRRKLLVALFGGSFVSMVIGFVGPDRLARPEATRRAQPHVVDDGAPGS